MKDGEGLCLNRFGMNWSESESVQATRKLLHSKLGKGFQQLVTSWSIFVEHLDLQPSFLDLGVTLGLLREGPGRFRSDRVQEGLEPYFLDTQFRSHPKLMEWVAGSIYEGRLQSPRLSHDMSRPFEKRQGSII